MSVAFDAISKLLALGGPVVLILLVLSIIALAAALLKLWQYTRVGRSNPDALRRIVSAWATGDAAGARTKVTVLSGPVAPILSNAMNVLAAGADPVHVREDVERLAVRTLNSMRSGLRVLEVIAQTAPLLGLFGTVLGMIEAFRQLQAAGSQVDPAILAGGIWVALLTTAAGLAVAMPVSIILAAFEARIARENGIMDDVLTALFTGAPAEPGMVKVPAPAVPTEPGYAHG
ncbi:MAG: MotA/TolQ/ExbB proton channel family protein [Pseudomonadota bacterium]